jgi:hypothetical protein
MQQVEKIALSRNTSVRLRVRALYNLQTREARGSEELNWQRKLTELDPELHLRWHWLLKHYSIYYDHHGLLTTIVTFEPWESFGKVYQNLRHNAHLDGRALQQMKRDWEEGVEKAQDYQIEEAAEEFAIELHHCTRRRVINDGVKDNDY